MADLRAYLEKKVREIISTWNEADIYAVSLFVHSNEAYAVSYTHLTLPTIQSV